MIVQEIIDIKGGAIHNIGESIEVINKVFTTPFDLEGIELEGNKIGVIKDIINPGYYVYEIEIDNTLYYVNDVHIVNESKEV